MSADPPLESETLVSCVFLYDVENKNVVVFGLGLRGRRCAAGVLRCAPHTPTAHLILAQRNTIRTSTGRLFDFLRKHNLHEKL